MSLVPSASSSSLSDTNSFLMKIYIPELKAQKTAKLQWDMTTSETVAHICKLYRLDSPDKYSLFLPLETMPSADSADEDLIRLTPQSIMVRAVNDKVGKPRKRTVVTEEEGYKLGIWLGGDQQLMSYPAVETSQVQMRRSQEYIYVLFQNGEWVGELRYSDSMTLPSLLSLALFVGKKIDQVTSGGVARSHFLVDITNHKSSTGTSISEEGGWPQTLFLERRNMWLEQTDTDLKSQGIVCGDQLELKVKPKLVRVFLYELNIGTTTSKMIKYMHNTSVKAVTEQILDLRSVNSTEDSERENTDDYGIFLSHNGKAFQQGGEGLWLASDKRLASYNLDFNDSLYFSQLPEQQRRKKTLLELPIRKKSIIAVDIFTSTPYYIPFDFDTTAKDIIVEFIQRVRHKHYLSIISNLGLFLPARDDCMCMPYSNLHQHTPGDPLSSTQQMPMRCCHGKWIADQTVISQCSFAKCDYLEVREQRIEDEDRERGGKRFCHGIARSLSLVSEQDLDEEEKIQRQFYSQAGLQAEVAVLLYPFNKDREFDLSDQSGETWERLFVPISSSTSVRDLKRGVMLLSSKLVHVSPDLAMNCSVRLLDRNKNITNTPFQSLPTTCKSSTQSPSRTPVGRPPSPGLSFCQGPLRAQAPRSPSPTKSVGISSPPSTSRAPPSPPQMRIKPQGLLPAAANSLGIPIGSPVTTPAVPSTNLPSSLFKMFQKSTFNFPEIHEIPQASDLDLVVPLVSQGSVMFICEYGRAFIPQKASQITFHPTQPTTYKQPNSLTSSKKVLSNFAVGVSFGNTKRHTFRYSRTTTVKNLIDYIGQLKNEVEEEQEGEEGKESNETDYGIFLSCEGSVDDEGIWLKERRTLVSYGLLDECSCPDPLSDVVTSCPCSTPKSLAWKQKAVYVDASVFPHLLSCHHDFGGLAQFRIGKLLEIAPDTSAETLISKMMRGLETDQPYYLPDLGLFLPQFSCWLKGADSLVEMVRQAGQQQLQVHIRLRPQRFPVLMAIYCEDNTQTRKDKEKLIEESAKVKLFTRFLDVDIGAPFQDGLVPLCCSEFFLSQSGSFRLDILRSEPKRSKKASKLEKLLKTDLIFSSYSRGLEFSEESKLKAIPFELSRPLSIQGADKNTDILVVQYLPPQDDDEEGGCNIWDEPPSSDANVQYEEIQGQPKQVLAAATLNKLVEALASEEKVDPEYLDAFLLTYESFTSSFTFLNKLIQRFNVPPNFIPNLSQEEFELHVQNPIRVRVCNVLRKWIELSCAEMPEELTSRIGEFAQTIAQDPSTFSLAKILNNSLRRAKEPRAHHFQFSERPPPPILPRSLYDEKFSILEVDEEEIARQIAIIDYDHFRSIKPSEFLNQAWAKTKLHYRARNVLKMISWFNHISKLTAYLILSTEQLRQRVKVVSKLIQIAKFARQYNNFGAVMGIYSGFNNASILRLKITMSHLPRRSTEALAEIEELMTSQGSYRSYREAMATANPPLIPYMGVHLSDLTFIEEGNPDKMGNLINFSKRKLVSKQISQLQQYQSTPYNLDPVPRIIKIVSKPVNATDDDLYKLSLLREPRNANKTAKKG